MKFNDKIVDDAINKTEIPTEDQKPVDILRQKKAPGIVISVIVIILCISSIAADALYTKRHLSRKLDTIEVNLNCVDSKLDSIMTYITTGFVEDALVLKPSKISVYDSQDLREASPEELNDKANYLLDKWTQDTIDSDLN